jgi:hypothetical protein
MNIDPHASFGSNLFNPADSRYTEICICYIRVIYTRVYVCIRFVCSIDFLNL